MLSEDHANICSVHELYDATRRVGCLQDREVDDRVRYILQHISILPLPPQTHRCCYPHSSLISLSSEKSDHWSRTSATSPFYALTIIIFTVQLYYIDKQPQSTRVNKVFTCRGSL